MAKIEITVSDKFRPLYQLPPDINMVICIGGRGGMKTYEVSKFAAFASTMKKKRVAVLRDEKETIRESILNEIFSRYDTANQYGHFDGLYEKSDNGIRDKQTGNMIVFTKGFRASSLEKRTNLKGVSDTDIAIIEEAEDIRDFNKFSVFKDSIRTEGRLIIVILNTPDIQHWIIQRYFTLEQVEDGYWKLIPKKIKGFMAIQTSYKDNVDKTGKPNLPADVIRDYESYGNPESNMYDPHYYKTAILGYASSGRKGQILTKIKPISMKDYMALDLLEVYGQDFGTSKPAGTVGGKFQNNRAFFREMNYKPLPIIEIGMMYAGWGFADEELIIADSAEPLSIGQLRRGWNEDQLTEDLIKNYPRLKDGFNVRGAIKGADSINTGLSKMTGMEIYICEESTNFWKEIYNYVWATDKNGNYTSDPIDDWNHLIDPTRYLVSGRGRFF